MIPTNSLVNRRDFFKAGAIAAAGSTLMPHVAASPQPVIAEPIRATADACIWINLVGGPSQ